MSINFRRIFCRSLPALCRRLFLVIRGVFWGCIDEKGSLTASMLVSRFQMVMEGQLVSACGAGAVAVDLLHRKEHLAQSLIRHFLEQCIEAHAPVALLYPFCIGFYRKMGFGLLTENYRFRFRPDQLSCVSADKSRLHVAEPSDHAELLAFYHRWALNHNGMLLHPIWDELRIFEGKSVVIHRNSHGEIDGYCCFRINPAPLSAFYSNQLTVHELVCSNRNALGAFSALLASLSDQFAYIDFYTPFQSSHLLASDPDSGENDAYHNGIQEYARYCGGCMAKIVDLDRFYSKAIQCAQKLQIPGFCVRLEIQDDLPTGNSHPSMFTLCWENGLLYPGTNRQTADAVISGKISDYTSFALGAASLESLHFFSRLNVTPVQYIPYLQEILGKRQKPVCFTYF